MIGIGVRRRPASSGVNDEPCWSRNGSRKVAVNRPEKTITRLASPAEKARIRKRARSIIGCTARVSTRRKSGPEDDEGRQEPERRRARPAPRLAVDEREEEGEDGGRREGGARRGRTTGRRRGAARPAGCGPPTGSRRSRPARSRGRSPARCRTRSGAPRAPGPRLSPIDTLMALMPRARPRSPGPNVRATIAGPIAWSIPAPTPWRIRNTIRTRGARSERRRARWRR